MVEQTNNPQFGPSDEPESKLEFIDCNVCKGFGYEVTGTKKHIQCKNCHDDPSMYAILNGQLLFWDLQISAAGIRRRSAREIFHKGFNFLLFFTGIGGVVALGIAGFLFINSGGDILDFFFEQDPIMALFWASIILDMLLYYRVSQERTSNKILDYSEAALKEKTKQAVKRPANPTYDKYDKLPKAQKHDISDFFTKECIKAIEGSFELAKKLEHHQITPLHLMGALMDSTSVTVMLARLGLNKDEIFKKIGKAMAVEGIESGTGLDLGLEANRFFFHAYEEALKMKRKQVDVMELFVSLIHNDRWLNEIFYDLEIEDKTVRNVVEWIHIQNNLRDRYRKWKKKAGRKPKGIMDRAMTARPSPLLESVSQDYTAVSASGGFFPMIGRDDEMDQVLRIIRDRIGSIMLVGPPGVGKTSLLEGLAELMTSEEVPAELQDKRLIVMDPGALIANAKGTGVIEGRILQVANEIARAGNIVLGIEDIHHLVNMRSTGGSEDAAGVLMNALSKGMVKVIATTTTKEYQEFISQRGPFIRRFQMVTVDELKRDSAILVLEAKAGSIEFKNKVFFSYAALEACVDMSMKFIQDRYLPAKALDIMRETAGYVQGNKGEGSLVTKDDVAQIVSEKTNVQVTAITQDERDRLLNLEDVMHERVVGQDEAVKAVASALRRAREGLRDTNRPIANLMFLGPTGVGKTETAKTIAEIYFGGEENMTRFDMSEFQDIRSMRKLIGAEGKQGQLTEAVRLTPFSLILLDELEKAHPDILNLFLQVLDDGRITDGTGKTFDLSNTMIIATSNAGTQVIQNSFAAGVNVDEIKTKLMNETLSKFFKPEFVNRFDNIVLFKPLTLDEITEITRRMMAGIAKRMADEKGIVIEVTPEAINELAKKGYDPLYGARPLKRVIQDTVDDALARLLLSDQIRRRDIVVLQPGGQMTIKKAQTL